ncbi:glycosyl transferase family 1 [Vaginella massiliensis]|uniref:glycosyl transferase family 1 n=1 Tax=Vaginella massiliensis TaxID=1816680 RepID=UPI003753AF85
MPDKKVLIISYYWPPAGGPGVQRWLKFTKYLPEFGIEPHVYIPANPSYPILDASLEKDIHPNVKIIRNKIWEPYQLAEKINPKNKAYKGGQFEKQENQSILSKISVFIRGNFFIPDARKFWIKPSIHYLINYIAEHQIQTIITTGPPHSLHLIGLGLKEKFPTLKWLADFRDPWTQISYHKELKLTKWSAQKHKQLERRVLQQADMVLATSFGDAKNFENLGATNVTVITNGFEAIERIRKEDHQHFDMTYSGGLEMLRNPLVVWQSLSELCQEITTFGEDVRLNFYGSLAADVKQSILDAGLQSIVREHGYVQHKDSLKAIQHANILLLTNFDNPQSKGIIPGKLFEYMATGNPILAVGPANADVQKILEETRAGIYFLHDEKSKIKTFIQQQYLLWLKNPEAVYSPNIEAVKQYTRRNLTERLVELL